MVVTQTALQEIAKWLVGDSATAPTHSAVGTDTTTPDDEDTTLGNELVRNANATATAGTDSATFSMILATTEANGNNLSEAGLFNAGTNGDMYVRFTHGDIVKTASVEVEYTIVLRITNG